ncbi:MAG: hypothetical protein RLY86_3003 [Pseudomonadota bacterium]|jgi:hypothetical protein
MNVAKTMSSAFTLLTVGLAAGLPVGLAAGSALAQAPHLDLHLRPGEDRSEGSASFFMPLLTREGSLTFGEFRAYVEEEELFASAGFGHRLSLTDDIVAGGFVYFDYTQTDNNNDFSQTMVGVDVTNGMWELRGNYYNAITQQAKVGDVVFSAPRLDGNFVSREILQPREIALDGWDVEAAVRVGGIGDLDLRVAGGWYSFSESNAEDREGWRGRAELMSDDTWAFGLEVRDDDWYGTQTFAVLRLRLGGDPAAKGKARLLSRAVERRDGIVIADPSRTNPDRVGVQRYSFGLGGAAVGFGSVGQRIHFVAAGATNGAGTVDSPFNSVAAAATAAGANELIHVREGTYTGNITLKDGQTLMGSAVALTVGNTVLVPAGNRPTLTATTGNVVTLGNDNTVTGFRIVAPAGTGDANRDQFAAIYGNNVRVGSITGNDLTGNTGTGGTSSVGVRLDNMAGVRGTRAQTRHFASNTTQLPFYASYDPGVGFGNAEIIAFSETTGLGVVALGDAGAVDVVRLGEGDIAGLPITVRRDNILAGVTSAVGATAAGNLTTVSIDPLGRYYVSAVQHTNGLTNGLVEIRNITTGAVIQRVTVGIGPDGTAISPNGRWLVVANEAERLDAPGSVTVVDMTNAMTGGAVATQVALTDQTGTLFDNSGRLGTVINTDIDGITNGPVAHTPNGLQPEYVAFSPDSRFAFISLQENNGAMVIDLGTGQPANIRYFNLGTVTAPADVVDSNPPVYNFNGQITNFNREPDGLAAFTIGSQLYFVTADEGDNRTNFSGSRLRGGRSVTVFNATTGQVVGTTGGALDRAVFDAANAAMAANPTIYGVRNDGVNPHYYPEGRSDRGGVEPEVLTTFQQGNSTYALVGLERGASIALIDLTNPATPTVSAIGLLPRDLTRRDGFDLLANSEGVVTLQRGTRRFVYTGLEDNGIVAIWGVQPPAGN